MTANAAPIFDRRFWLWLGAGVGMVLLAVGIVVARAKAKAKTTGQPGTTPRPDPIPPGTSTPPLVPPPTLTPDTVIASAPVPQTNYDYVRNLTWKMDATVNNQGDYACEVTNGIIEMGAQDLAAFAELYLNWYGRSLKDDYCGRVKSSGCWSSWWDGKHANACARLQTT